MSKNGKRKPQYDRVSETYKWDTVAFNNVLTRGMSLLQKGFSIDAVKQKIVPMFPPTSSPDAPWIYVRPAKHKNCTFWHTIVFDTYGMFPVGCLNCWKVVVRPRTVEELMMLLEYQENEYEGFCKCGIEVRPFVHGNWGGYFYNDSLEQGQECFQRVRADISRIISPDVPVILKRACTEFELRYGDSTKWEDILENGSWSNPAVSFNDLVYSINLIANKIELPEDQVPEGAGYVQPGLVKVHVTQKILEHAWSIGDKTVLKFRDGGKPLYEPSRTYHDREIADEEKEKYTGKQLIKQEVEG